MQTLVAQILAAWRHAERLTETFPWATQQPVFGPTFSSCAMSANGLFTAAERGSATKPGAGSPAPLPELKGI